MSLRELMRQPAPTITPDTTLAEAWRQSQQQGCAHWMVQDAGGLQGVLSIAGLQELDSSTLERTRVRDRMQAPIQCLTPDLSVQEAARLLRQTGLDCLPVCEDACLLGYVTACDLLDVLCGGASTIEEGAWCALGDHLRWRIHPTMP